MTTNEFLSLSESQKEKLKNFIVNDLTVLDVPPKCTCSKCGKVAIFHYMFSCDHVYCRTCYNSVITGNRQCIKCHVKVTNETKQNKKLECEIYNLKCECPNRIRGCKETKSLQYLLEHLKSCNFSEVKLLPMVYATNGRNDAIDHLIDECESRIRAEFETKLNSIRRETAERMETFLARMEIVESLDSRLKKIENVIADSRMERTTTEKERSCNCSKRSDNLDRINLHVEKMAAEAKEGNVRMDRFVSRYRDRIEKLECRISRFENNLGKIEDIESALNSLKSQDLKLIRDTQKHTLAAITSLRGQESGSFIWKIGDVNKKITAAKKLKLGTQESTELVSESFYSNERGRKMKVQVVAKFNSEGLYLGLRCGPGDSELALAMVLPHRCSLSILDQSDRQNKRNIFVMFEQPFGRESAGRLKIGRLICTLSQLEITFRNIYVKNDRLLVLATVEPMFPLPSPPFSNDGTLIWNIGDYETKKQHSLSHSLAKFGEYDSDSFYSGVSGFRMLCDLRFERVSTECLVLRLNFFAGEFDEHLPDVYPHRVTYCILDQSERENSKPISIEVKLDPAKSGPERAKQLMDDSESRKVIIPCSKFETPPFLMNDSIVIKVVVEPL